MALATKVAIILHNMMFVERCEGYNSVVSENETQCVKKEMIRNHNGAECTFQWKV